MEILGIWRKIRDNYHMQFNYVAIYMYLDTTVWHGTNVDFASVEPMDLMPNYQTKYAKWKPNSIHSFKIYVLWDYRLEIFEFDHVVLRDGQRHRSLRIWSSASGNEGWHHSR